MAHQRLRFDPFSDSVRDILNPARGIREERARKGLPVADHHRENLRRVRQLQQQKQLELEEKERVRTVSHQLTPSKGKYRHVKSRILEPKKPIDWKSSPDENKKYLKAGTRERRLQQQAATKVQPRRRIRKQSPLPKVEKTRSKPSGTRDFLAENLAEAGKHRIRKKSPPSPISPTHARGKVPSYLAKRQQTWAMQKAQQEAEEERRQTIPEGMVLLADEERLEALEALNQRKGETERELSRLPIKIDTIGLKKHHEYLLKLLDEIEQGIVVFSRPKVFVRDE